MIGREKIVGEDLRSGIWQLGRNDDERREVLVVGAEAITYPGSDTGSGKRY